MQFETDNKFDALLVGDVSQVFWDKSDIEGLNIQKCADVMDAITTAGEKNFDTIYVVISSLNGNLESAVNTLGTISKKSRLVLLAQMYEEPIARKMLRTAKHPENVVDDYCIYPVDIRNLFAQAVADNTKTKTETQEFVPELSETVPLIAEVSQVSQNQDARIRELEKLATEDDLTGLKNRRYLREFLKQILSRAEDEGFNATLLLFDIDNFKHYNDAYGHAVGNNVLVQTAMMMKRCWREHDVVGRIGGDEFAVVFWDRPLQPDDLAKNINDGLSPRQRRRKQNNEHPQEAIFIAERFRSEMNATDLCLLGTDGKGELTISGGLASFPRDGGTVDEIFEKADQAMLEAKRSGKNQIYLVGNPGI